MTTYSPVHLTVEAIFAHGLYEWRDCLISTLRRAWQAFLPKYEYLQVNACKEKLWRQSSTAVLMHRSARSYYIFVTASGMTLLLRARTRRGVLVQVLTSKSVICATDWSIYINVIASTLPKSASSTYRFHKIITRLLIPIVGKL